MSFPFYSNHALLSDVDVYRFQYLHSFEPAALLAQSTECNEAGNSYHVITMKTAYYEHNCINATNYQLGFTESPHYLIGNIGLRNMVFNVLAKVS